VKKVIQNAKRSFLPPLIKPLSKHIPELYESILEAAERGELWGINSELTQVSQLELDLSSAFVDN